jgi:hypothetical protein
VIEIGVTAEMLFGCGVDAELSFWLGMIGDMTGTETDMTGMIVDTTGMTGIAGMTDTIGMIAGMTGMIADTTGIGTDTTEMIGTTGTGTDGKCQAV